MSMKKASVAVVLAVGCLIGGTASAVPIDFSAGPLGDLGASQTTYSIPGDPLERVLLVSGFHYDGANWDDANLYRRRQTNDNGLGVCNPNEAPCPGPSGGGDINELDNSGTPELIRLALPDGFTWTSVGLSSLDNNDGAGPERGQLWADDDDDLSNGFGSLVAQFEFEGTIEPDILIPMAFMSSPYLIFEPIDWFTPTLSASTSKQHHDDGSQAERQQRLPRSRRPHHRAAGARALVDASAAGGRFRRRGHPPASRRSTLGRRRIGFDLFREEALRVGESLHQTLELANVRPRSAPVGEDDAHGGASALRIPARLYGDGGPGCARRREHVGVHHGLLLVALPFLLQAAGHVPRKTTSTRVSRELSCRGGLLSCPGGCYVR
jgi:hypothetical protein